MVRFSLLFSLLYALSAPAQAATATAYFAGGCFWCMESAYQEHEGVTDVISGFIGGKMQNPTYKGRHDGHYEAVEVSYDPTKINYQQLLDFYWVNVDPFDARGQFCDKGASYRSAIFVSDDNERLLAEKSLSAVSSEFSKQTVQTEVLDATQFWPVEEGHQDYYLKNPVRYKYYRWNCGRDQRLEAIWGDRARH